MAYKSDGSGGRAMAGGGSRGRTSGGGNVGNRDRDRGGAGGPQGAGRTDGRRAGPQGRATPHQVASNPGAGVRGAGSGFTDRGDIRGPEQTSKRPSVWGRYSLVKTPTRPATVGNILTALGIAASFMAMPGAFGLMGPAIDDPFDGPVGTTDRRQWDARDRDDRTLHTRLQDDRAPVAKPQQQDDEGELERKRNANSAGGAGFRKSLLAPAGRRAVSGKK